MSGSTRLLSRKLFLNTLHNTNLRMNGSLNRYSSSLNRIRKVNRISTKSTDDEHLNQLLQNHLCQPLLALGKHSIPTRTSQRAVMENIYYDPIVSFQRLFTTSSSLLERLKPEDVRKRVDVLAERFAEARELLGDARESLGSSYFSEDMIEAQEAVSSTIAFYEDLLTELEEDQRNDVVRTIGLRMEEMKAQEQAIKDLLE